MDTNCDGSGPHMQPMGVERLRKLPTGGDSNVILCRACFYREIAWRKQRNKELEDFAKYPLPKWNELEKYNPGE